MKLYNKTSTLSHFTHLAWSPPTFWPYTC